MMDHLQKRQGSHKAKTFIGTITAALVCFIAGCAPRPMQLDNLQPYLKETLVYRVPYQALYKCFVESDDLPMTVLGATYGGTQLYNELNLAVWYMGAERTIYKRLEFKPLSAKISEVRMYAVLDYKGEAARLHACGHKLQGSASDLSMGAL